MSVMTTSRCGQGASGVRLKEGRWLAYNQYGLPGAKPILYFHGWPGSRLEARLADAVARDFNARIIAIDRPGFGMSDFQPGRAILDWPSDVVELADALELERFAVVGVSGGGPYALACALKIPTRIACVAVICGVGPPQAFDTAAQVSPLHRRLLHLCHAAPWLIRALFALTAWQFRHHSDWYLSLISKSLCVADQLALRRSEVKSMIVESVQESIRNGTRGPIWEGKLYTRPWGFELQDISKQIYLWHGERDLLIPPPVGYFQAKNLPNCIAKFLPDEGHFSLITNHLKEFFDALTAP
jgi:pimeloyl-ACP methyl ester carboxylesterase